LSCASCGAPLHEMKMLHPKRTDHALHHKPKKPPHPVGKPAKPMKQSRPKKSKIKRKKSLFSKVFEEFVDVIEDVFD
jgi:ribosomal protein L34E